MNYQELDRYNLGIRSAYCIQACRIIKKDSSGLTLEFRANGKVKEMDSLRPVDWRELEVGDYVDMAVLASGMQCKLAPIGKTPEEFVPAEGRH